MTETDEALIKIIRDQVYGPRPTGAHLSHADRVARDSIAALRAAGYSITSYDRTRDPAEREALVRAEALVSAAYHEGWGDGCDAGLNDRHNLENRSSDEDWLTSDARAALSRTAQPEEKP